MPDIAERSLHTRLARSAEAIKRSFVDNLLYIAGRTLESATALDHYTALAYTIRDRMLARMVASEEARARRPRRTVAYLSAEYLVGPHLGNNIFNLGLQENVRGALEELGLDLEVILDTEKEPGLGNGGLGRLAACFMDSLATLEIPAIGYGIRYEYGIFEQLIHDGWQVEAADAWLRNGNPWEIPAQRRFPIHFGGRLEHETGDDGCVRTRWIPESTIFGIALDTPILGYGVLNVNTLRLWKSEADVSFDFQAFNHGDYYGAVDDMVIAENVTKVLYPNDEPIAGKSLRLRQQYFFVSCSLQDMLAYTLAEHGSLERFPERYAVALNDTHPAIAIAELMRLLVDDHAFDWDRAWAITQRSFSYTNHTVLPEAMETWPVELFRSTLPRHLEIVYAINARFLDEVRMRFLGDVERVRRMSMIDEGSGDGIRRVRMAHLACVGSKAINGVAHMHSRVLTEETFRDFHQLWPQKFYNVTNGVTPRRFIGLANPPLAALIDEVVGGDWLRDPGSLRRLEDHLGDSAFRMRWRSIKRLAKARLADYILRTCGVAVDPDTLFDAQVKRIHEYKRQHLNLLHIVSLYHRLKHGTAQDVGPRTFIFGGKAAPGYRMAKLIVKLINAVADVINRDPQVNRVLRIVFVANFNVKTGQRIYPAVDLSEQISTAGKEASGTGNMKCMMNGALIIGTRDGANPEIMEVVGADNFFLFGKTAGQIDRVRDEGYRPRDIYHDDEALRAAIDLIDSGLFSHGDRELFRPLTADLLDRDPFLVCADFQDYVDCQRGAGARYADEEAWTRMSVLNVARSGPFSSDRAVRQYQARVWNPGSQ